MHEVTVSALWRSKTTFDFPTEAEAASFRERVQAGTEDGLAAIADKGDVDSSNAELVDWEAVD